MRVLIVSSNYYKTEEICKKFRSIGTEAAAVYRVYNINSAIENFKPTIILTNYTCKDRDENGQSYGVFCNPAEYFSDKITVRHLIFWRLVLAFASIFRKPAFLKI
jgi:hypothetical protein